jgi:hypothetical protein
MSASVSRDAVDRDPPIVNRPATAVRSLCTCGEIDGAQRALAIAAQQVADERVHRRRLEHALREEVSQELAGIALMVSAVRRLSDTPRIDRDARLREVADLLASTIGLCNRLIGGS